MEMSAIDAPYPTRHLWSSRNLASKAFRILLTSLRPEFAVAGLVTPVEKLSSSAAVSGSSSLLQRSTHCSIS